MSGRAERLGRVLAVQRQKRRLEEWRLGEIERAEADLRRNEAELLETLGAQSLMQGLFLEGKAAALRRNDLALREAAERREAAAASLRETMRIEKRIERAADEAASLQRRADENAELLSALDDHLSQTFASFK